jgi:hypothetical protein
MKHAILRYFRPVIFVIGGALLAFTSEHFLEGWLGWIPNEWKGPIAAALLGALVGYALELQSRYHGIIAQLNEAAEKAGKPLVPAVSAFVRHYADKTGNFAQERLAKHGNAIFWEAIEWGCSRIPCDACDAVKFERESRERVTRLNNALLGLSMSFWATEVRPPSQLTNDSDFRKEQIKGLWPWTNAKRLLFLSAQDFEQEIVDTVRKPCLEDFLEFNSIRRKYRKQKKWRTWIYGGRRVWKYLWPRRHINLRIVLYFDKAGPYENSKLARLAKTGPCKLKAHDYAVYGKKTAFTRADGQMTIQAADGNEKYANWFASLWETADERCFDSNCANRDACPFAAIKDDALKVLALVSRTEVIDLADYQKLRTARDKCSHYQALK